MAAKSCYKNTIEKLRSMNMKKKIWIIVFASVAAVALIVTAVVALASGDAKRSWQEKYDLGVRYLSNGNYEEAVIAFTAAIKIDPRNPELYIGRAEAYMGLGNIASARADYETALEIDDTLVDAWLGLAETYVAEGDIEKALEILQDAATKMDDPRIKARIEELESKPTPSHVHVWLEATCTEPKTCSECGETEGEPIGHDMLPATPESPSTCSRCGYTEGEPLSPGHVHVWTEATCTAPRVCTECGATEGVPLGHDMFPATTESPSTCSRCGYTDGEPLSPEHVHTWVDATCTAPRTCSGCGATEGAALGHDMRPATALTPSNCSRCGYTEGEPIASFNAFGATDFYARSRYIDFEKMPESEKKLIELMCAAAISGTTTEAVDYLGQNDTAIEHYTIWNEYKLYISATGKTTDQDGDINSYVLLEMRPENGIGYCLSIHRVDEMGTTNRERWTDALFIKRAECTCANWQWNGEILSNEEYHWKDVIWDDVNDKATEEIRIITATGTMKDSLRNGDFSTTSVEIWIFDSSTVADEERISTETYHDGLRVASNGEPGDNLLGMVIDIIEGNIDDEYIRERVFW